MGQSIPDEGGSRGGSPVVRRVHPARPWLLGLLYAAALLPLTLAPRVSGNVLSRYMTIESIVERGGLPVERSPLLARSGSPDLVRFGSHYYSDKPPVLPALAAPLYAVLYALGVRFSGPPPQFVIANAVLVWGVVGVSSALAVVWLRQVLQAVPVARWAADLLALGFGFGTPLLSYAVTFNNHSVAAALITGALSWTLLEDPGRRPGRSRFGAGFLIGLAATIDLPAGGAVLAGLGIWQAFRARAIPWPFLAGAAGPLLLHCWLQSRVTGSPLPVEMYPEAFRYPGSYWTTPAGAWREKGPRWRFALELLLGPQGWLTVTPVLALGLIGLGWVLSRRRDPLRPLAGVVGGALVVLVVYYTWGVRRTDFAGQSFGTRHLLPVAPAVYFFAVAALGRFRGHRLCVVFALLFAVGAVYAVAGMKDPWSRIEARAPREPALRLLQRAVVYPWSSYDR